MPFNASQSPKQRGLRLLHHLTSQEFYFGLGQHSLIPQQRHKFLQGIQQARPLSRQLAPG